ncbi:MAG: tetratricopeptide repeat protein, partial [Gammaproteobacteria bacterium]
MAALALDAPTERIAVNLLRHLEWQADGFSLIFLFADVGPSLQLADWLDQRLALHERPLQRQEAKDEFARNPEAAVDALMARLAEVSSRPGALWFGAQRHPSDAQWNRARRLYLARLNERRFLMERDLRRPLVLVLPADFRPEARAIAPDIWHVRVLSEELRAPSSTGTAGEQRPSPVPASRVVDAATPAYAEWMRMQPSVAADRVFLPTAWRACEELLSAGRPADAEQVARSALSLARQRVNQSFSPSALRDLSIALNNVGAVARAQGDWAQAESVYREGLALRRQLVERLGGTPEALRDLSVSLNNVGAVARAQGDWAQAASVYRECLALRRQLVERLGGTPEALRDLS